MTAQEILLKAKDEVAYKHGYQLFKRETGGWTRFDKLYDESGDADRKKLLDEVAYEAMLIGIEHGIVKGVKFFDKPKTELPF